MASAGGRTGAVAMKRARAAVAAEDGVLPKKADFRQRAHINPLSHQLYEYPVAPPRAQWPRHYPRFSSAAVPGALAPGVGVRAVDVGCGFGGLTLALAEALPETSLVLGMEIRPKVTEYVRLRLQAMRKGGGGGGAGGEGATASGGGGRGRRRCPRCRRPPPARPRTTMPPL